MSTRLHNHKFDELQIQKVARIKQEEDDLFIISTSNVSNYPTQILHQEATFYYMFEYARIYFDLRVVIFFNKKNCVKYRESSTKSLDLD